MSNAQVVFDRLPSVAPNSFIRFNIIDNGDGTRTIYIEDRPNSDANSNAANIPTTGDTILAGSSTTAQGLSKNGTTVSIDTNGNIIATEAAAATFFQITGGASNSILLIMGPATSSGAGLKRSNTHIQARLGDDSGFAPFDSGAITVVAGNVVLDNNQAIRIKDSGGTLTTTLTISTGNNLTLNTPASSGNMLFQIPNATGTAFFIFNSATVLTISQTGALGFADGVRQTFNPNTTTPGLNVGSQAGDPSTPINGDLWYDSTGSLLRARVNGVTISLGAGANTTLSNLTAPTAINTDLLFGADNTNTIGAVGGGRPSALYTNAIGIGNASPAAGEIRIGTNTGQIVIQTTNINMGPTVAVGWSSGDPAGVPKDTAIVRDSAGVVKITDGGAGIGNLLVGVITPTGAILFPDNVRQTFNPGATVAGLNVGSLAGNPSIPTNADLWYDSTADQLKARINGVTVVLGQTGISGSGTTNAIPLFTASTTLGDSNLIQGTNIIEERNGVNGQTLRIYKTFTDASNYERLVIDATSSPIVIKSESLGTGVARPLRLACPSGTTLALGGDASVVSFEVGSTAQLNVTSGKLAPQTNNAVDLGDNTGPRNFKDLYLAGNVRAATYSVGAVAGVDGTFTTVDLKTVTVTKGIITSIV